MVGARGGILGLGGRGPASPVFSHLCLQTRAAATKVRLKWVKNRGLDHIIDRDTDVKAACLLKDAILRCPSGAAARSLAPLQKTLGLTVPVLRFLRRYPTLFREAPHPRYPSLPTFSLSDAAHLLHRREQRAHLAGAGQLPFRPLPAIAALRWDLGLPDDFLASLVPAFSDHFRVERRRRDGVLCLSLSGWKEELAVSELEKMNQRALSEAKQGEGLDGGVPSSALHLPYEDVSSVDPESELMEKHVVGVLHELLSLTIHKKTKRNYLRALREELNLPHRFTRVFTRYPGIFYLSLKCKTTTVVLREGYRRGKLVDPHPLALVRDKFHYVMRTGVLYRDGGLEEAKLAAGEDDELSEEEEEAEEQEDEDEGEEYYEGSDGDDD
ncbi:unnamed protein product [Spirodela intermedia]|uniref:PORR domain-containing protein n=1 Tax=Spirodela intermedia TaxID=51605 RepID=A0A7I8IMI9_SPIIN|nr:unnamed protein product [Spirodela intermedia]CAA6659056.1 unnamed protein product [Spirodela intermedia]